MLSPVSTALMKMRLTLVAVPALSASNPASFHPFKISCPSALRPRNSRHTVSETLA